MAEWAKEGFDPLDDELKRREFSNEERKGQLYRFWLNKGDQGNLLMLEDKPLTTWEHNIKIDGKYGHFFTCLSKTMGKTCPLCDRGDKPYFAGMFIVVDRRAFKDKEGKERKDTLKLLCAKTDLLEKLSRKSKKLGGLRGKEFTFFRSVNDKSPSTGDDIEHAADVSEEEMLKFSTETLKTTPDALKAKKLDILEPKTEEQIRKFVGSAPAGGSKAESDDIPF